MSASLVCSVLAAFASSQGQYAILPAKMDVSRTDTDYTIVSFVQLSWFLSLEDARDKVEAWRQEYNRERSHGALGNLAPLEYASLVDEPQD